MKIVTLKTCKLISYKKDPEFLSKAKRPCVLVVRLKYKGKNYNFAVPFRSNIPAGEKKEHYFSLPPRKATRSKNRHGLHYIKMFPINKSDTNIYRTEGNAEATRNKMIIDKNCKLIVTQCQEYLNRYEKGDRPIYATDIDFLLTLL